jgi:thermostable 8-oxoguanine DNA glycosylase
MNILNLPDPKKIIDGIKSCSCSLDGKTQTIEKWVEDYKKDINNNKQKSTDYQFLEFVKCLLARQTNERWWNPVGKWLHEEIKEINNVCETSITSKRLKELGYRFHPQGSQMICEVKKLFSEKYKCNWGKYLEEADKHYEDDFQNDIFLKVKNVKFKVRDFALSNFSTKYIAVDTHLVDILVRTGLLCYCYEYNLEPRTDIQNPLVYPEIRKLCVILSDIIKIEPGELDRCFWYFGSKSFCKNPPLCKKCPIKSICLFGSNNSTSS